MAQNKGKKIAFISTFNPRKCGIATFTSDLISSISACAKGQFQPIVVAMRADNTLNYSEPVKFEIRQEVKNDYICAADYINFSHVDAVSVQHEFGLFGGQAVRRRAGGSHILCSTWTSRQRFWTPWGWISPSRWREEASCPTSKGSWTPRHTPTWSRRNAHG